MKDKKNVLKEATSWAFCILVTLSIVTLVNSRAYAKVQVQQSSMENTLHSDQQLLVDKLSYNFTEPKRGDIVIFLPKKERGSIIDDTLETAHNILSGSQQNDRYVKRVIGVPGDEIDIRDGSVYVNGEKLDEPYANGETFPSEIKFPLKVEENKLFVLGDNRLVSMDSRAFGTINRNQVEGKAIYRVYPFNQIGKIK